MKRSILVGLVFLSIIAGIDAMQGNSPKDRIPKNPSNDRLPGNNPQHIKVSPRKNSTEQKRPDAPLTGTEKTALLKARNLK